MQITRKGKGKRRSIDLFFGLVGSNSSVSVAVVKDSVVILSQSKSSSSKKDSQHTIHGLWSFRQSYRATGVSHRQDSSRKTVGLVATHTRTPYSLPLSLPLSFPFHLISTKTPLTHYSNMDVPFSNMDVHLRKLYVSQRGIFFFNPSGIYLVLPKIFGQKNVEGKSLQVPLVDIDKNKDKTPTSKNMYKHEEEPLLLSSSPTKKRRNLPSFLHNDREDNLRTNTNPPDSRPKAVTVVRSGLSRAKEKDPPTVDSTAALNPTVEKCEEDVILVDLSFWPEPTPLISESVLKGDIEVLKNQFRAVLQHSKQSFHREVQQEIRRNRDIFEDRFKNQRAAFELRLAKECADRANVGSIRQKSVVEVLKAGTDSSDPVLSQHQSSIQGTSAPPNQSDVLQGLIEI